MGIFNKGLKEPVFLKEESNAQKQLMQLKSIQAKNTTNATLAKQINQDIQLLQYGIAGENAIAFELRNSHIPMYILHDLYLEHNGLTAQLDYILVTKGKTFILECKNLYGNIEINAAGDFIRTLQYKNGYKKEGIYSPITQNQRHLELLKTIISEKQPNFLRRAIFEKYFYEEYRSIVVLANPKTVLNARFAKKEVKSQVIKCDQLVTYIKRINTNDYTTSDKSMLEFAQFLLSLHKDIPMDYTEKYAKLLTKNAPQQKKADGNLMPKETPLCPKCGATMIKRQAKRGTYTGNVFWGCSNYPKCKCIINIDTTQNRK